MWAVAVAFQGRKNNQGFLTVPYLWLITVITERFKKGRVPVELKVNLSFTKNINGTI